jgi:hypothetical protein
LAGGLTEPQLLTTLSPPETSGSLLTTSLLFPIDPLSNSLLPASSSSDSALSESEKVTPLKLQLSSPGLKPLKINSSCPNYFLPSSFENMSSLLKIKMFPGMEDSSEDIGCAAEVFEYQKNPATTVGSKSPKTDFSVSTSAKMVMPDTGGSMFHAQRGRRATQQSRKNS